MTKKYFARLKKIFLKKTVELFLFKFWWSESESFFRFFPARQVLEIILDESSKNTENALIEWL
jgi:hypothetical protein